jgi:hypothetical protein
MLVASFVQRGMPTKASPLGTKLIYFLSGELTHANVGPEARIGS